MEGKKEQAPHSITRDFPQAPLGDSNLEVSVLQISKSLQKHFYFINSYF